MHKTKADRQQEAIERDLARDNRTPAEQLALIRQRPGMSLREIMKLWRQGATNGEAIIIRKEAKSDV